MSKFDFDIEGQNFDIELASIQMIVSDECVSIEN